MTYNTYKCSIGIPEMVFTDFAIYGSSEYEFTLEDLTKLKHGEPLDPPTTDGTGRLEEHPDIASVVFGAINCLINQRNDPYTLCLIDSNPLISDEQLKSEIAKGDLNNVALPIECINVSNATYEEFKEAYNYGTKRGMWVVAIELPKSVLVSLS